MADTQTPNIELVSQTIGGNNNTWGAILNNNFERLDDKLGDTTDVSLSGGAITLIDSQEFVAIIQADGELVEDAEINFSGRGGFWIIENNTIGAFNLTAKVTGQDGVVIDQGGAALVFCDGSDIRLGNPPASAAPEVTIASAATCNVLGAGSEYVAISGTTTITSLGTGTLKKRFVRALGAFKLTHNASTLILPGGKDITAVIGDTFLVISDDSSAAKVYFYTRSTGKALYSSIPTGMVMPYAGTSLPTGWLYCYGQPVSRADYPALFTALGVTYGSGDGVNTFNVPDVRGRVIAGLDNMGGTSANRLTNITGSLNGDVLGATGGAETHVLTVGQLAKHKHQSIRSNSTRDAGTDNGVVNEAWQDGDRYVDTSEAGNDEGHNNVQPTIILNAIIFTGLAA